MRDRFLNYYHNYIQCHCIQNQKQDYVNGTIREQEKASVK